MGVGKTSTKTVLRQRRTPREEEDESVLDDDVETTMMNAFREQKWAKLRAACRALAFDDAHRWSIEVKRRKTGHSVGNFDAYYVLDDDATKRYRSLKDVERKVLEEQKLVKKEKKTTTTLTTTTLTTRPTRWRP